MADDHRKRGYAPYPELVEPRAAGRHEPWEVVDSNDHDLPTNGMVDKTNRWIAVPLEPSGRPVTRHELAHVAWSPQKVPKVRFDPRVLGAVEDARVNTGLAARGLPMVLDAESRAHVCMLAAGDAKRGDTFALVARGVASIGTDVEDDLVAQLESLGRAGAFALERIAEVRDGITRSQARSSEGVASPAHGLKLARKLARALRAAGVLDARGRADSSVAGVCLGHAHGKPGGHDGPPGLPGLGGAGRGKGKRGDSGRMEIARPPLTVVLHRRRGPGRGYRPAAEGSVVRYLDRWPSGMIFRGCARRRGKATVLIDTSGSMTLSAKDLDRLLAETPVGVTVAIYSGQDAKGELRIVAARGLRASDAHLEPFAVGNVVDAPALAWLARQPSPRVWVSDGHVTGVGDRGSDAVRGECKELALKGRIRRVSDVDGAVDWLRGAKG